MNRIERLSAILIMLQTKQVVRGQDIADRFNISLRTAYRDIRALEESGVPLFGEAGAGYSLVEGYKLPPVMFTKEEAIAFITAEKLVHQWTDASTYAVYVSALDKIKAVLRSDDKAHLAEMDHHIAVLDIHSSGQQGPINYYLQSILKAIAEKTCLVMEYFAQHSQEKTKRTIEPVGIVHMAGHWHLMAYCRLRKDYRNFRMDRIKNVIHTEESFQKTHPLLKDYIRQMRREQRELHQVVIHVEKDYMRYIGDQKFYHGYVDEVDKKHYVEMTFLCDSLVGFARWYMMFGDRAYIVKPASLITMVNQIAVKIIQEKIYS